MELERPIGNTTRKAKQPASGVPSLPAGHPEGWADALRDLLRPFYAAVSEGAAPSVVPAPYPTFRNGARSVAFVDAVLESAAAGSWVAIPG